MERDDQTMMLDDDGRSMFEFRFHVAVLRHIFVTMSFVSYCRQIDEAIYYTVA